jgi:glycosyltransferase involved in cell wall biosynthesis
MGKMKIVMHCEYTGPAKDSMGSERVVEALTKAHLEMGHEVVMFLKPDSDASKLPAPLVDHIPEGFDIIHAHGGDPKVLDGFGIPWVSTLHGGGSDPAGSHWHNNPHYICVSDFICKLSQNKAFVHSCVDPTDFIYKEKKQDYFAWIAGTDWGEGKGLFTAIQLAKRMNLKLKIAGIGKNQEIINSIKSFCNDKIQYLGALNGEEKAEFLANAKALLFYSKLPDACPLTVAEALISGTPIIGSANGSLPELIKENCGIICQNEIELPRATMRVNKLKPEDCRKYALEHYSHTVAAKKYFSYYESMIAHGTVQ